MYVYCGITALCVALCGKTIHTFGSSAINFFRSFSSFKRLHPLLKYLSGLLALCCSLKQINMNNELTQTSKNVFKKLECMGIPPCDGHLLGGLSRIFCHLRTRYVIMWQRYCSLWQRYCSLQHNYPKDDVLLHRENICVAKSWNWNLFFGSKISGRNDPKTRKSNFHEHTRSS